MDLGGGFFAADFDLDGFAEFGMGGGDVAHADAEVHGGALGAADDFADLLGAVGGPDRVMGAGRGGSVGHFEGDQGFFDVAFFLFEKFFAAGEFAFFEGDETGEAGFDGGGLFVEFVSVEGVANFGAQGVARAEAGGFDAVGFAGLEDAIPDGFDDFGGGDEFETIFAGVAGAADPDVFAVEGCGGELIFFEFGRFGLADSGLNDGVNEAGDFRTLNGDGAGGIGNVFERCVLIEFAGGKFGFEPEDVGLDAGGVDDKKIFVFADAIGVEVVDDAAFCVAHEGVLAGADGEFADVVGEGAIEEIGGAGAGEERFAHVGDVEDAGGVADGLVFVGDGGVLDGHFPAAELD